jgi:hypothetical protein
MINKSMGTNFDTLCKAFTCGDTCLMECKRKSDGEIVCMVCAVQRDGEDIVMIPFAEMVSGNPFDDYYPPNPDGGFFEKGE